jgi:catechol 2,3-dioxygenase-like lactoylglutathione lyase family enzyme
MFSERSAAMSDEARPSPAPIPEHLSTVTPRLVVADGAAAIEFYRRAFGADEIGERFTDPDGRVIHAEIRIGDSVVMIAEDAGDTSPPARVPHSSGGIVMTRGGAHAEALPLRLDGPQAGSLPKRRQRMGAGGAHSFGTSSAGRSTPVA